MPLDSSSEKIFRDFEEQVLDVHHRQLALWKLDSPQAIFSLLAHFDCNAILSLVMPSGPPNVRVAQILKSLEEGLSQAVRWFCGSEPHLDVLPVVDRAMVGHAGEFCRHAGEYVDVADFHKMYGRGQVDVSVDEVKRTVRFTPRPENPGRSPLSGFAEQTYRIGRLPLIKSPADLERLREPALDVLRSAKFHTQDGRIVLDDPSIANDMAIRELLEATFPTEPVLLDPATDLAGFTLAQFSTYFEVLRRLSFCATSLFINEVVSGRRQQWECVPTQVMPRDRFAATICELSGLPPQIVEGITERLRFDNRTKSPDIHQQPLLVGQSHVAWSCQVVTPSKYVRNMLKLMSRTPALTDFTATLIGAQEAPMLRELGSLLSTKGGTQFKLTTELVLGGERAEIDLLGYNTKFPEEILVVEGKAVLGVDEVNEIAAATKEMQKGQKQLANAIALLMKLSEDDRARLYKFVKWNLVKNVVGVVVALDAEPNDQYDHGQYPGISLQSIKARLRANHFASPAKFWKACRERNWLSTLEKCREGYLPIKVGDVTYELPALVGPDDAEHEGQK